MRPATMRERDQPLPTSVSAVTDLVEAQETLVISNFLMPRAIDRHHTYAVYGVSLRSHLKLSYDVTRGPLVGVPEVFLSEVTQSVLQEYLSQRLLTALTGGFMAR